MSSAESRIQTLAVATVVGVAAGAAAIAFFRRQSDEVEEIAPPPERERRPSKGQSGVLTTQENRSSRAGVVARWTKPVVIASPALEGLATNLQKRLGCDVFSESDGPTFSTELFKSGDVNARFNWKRIVGRKVVFLFDTIDQSRLFEQLALLQALQGFAVPDGDDKANKWKTYVDAGKYSWGRAAHITVVLPWFRPCQMERTSRWQLTDGKWTNADPKGEWLDVPNAQYMARLLSTPGSVPPLPGPTEALDSMPLNPLWRPPVELLFVELHEEGPIRHCVSDLGSTIRTERFVPYYLDKFKAEESYPGKAMTYVLFPDKGAYDRYVGAVTQKLYLDADHILYIKKTRVGESIGQEQKLFFEMGQEQTGEKDSFTSADHVLIIDDFTNSGSTLFGAVNLLKKLVEGGGKIAVSIFVSHLVATYDAKVVGGILTKLKDLGPECKFVTTNTIPLTTDLFKGHPQAQVLDISDFIADLVQ